MIEIGIAYDLKPTDEGTALGPEDRFEEYDSESTVQAIAENLRALGYPTRLLGGGRALLETLLSRPPALVFNICEGFGGRSREAHVPALLEMLKVPGTHSDPLTCALTLDKGLAKRVVASAGIPTPAFFVAESAKASAGPGLRFPVIAKPLFEGSSMGIRKSSKLADARGLHERVAGLLADYGEPVLVEEFCPGPEFTVGILGSGEEARVIGVMEIIPKKDRPEDFVYSLEVKRNWREEVRYAVPPERDPGLTASVGKVALQAYRALACRDVGRVDIRLDREGRPNFLEVNPLPGINPITGDLVILSERSGLSYRELLGGIVESARRRHGI